jgi:UDP-N-acetylmuramyl pentapeptide phosphotransferase/UDP-N-acetylglucosamine-1-phosphate transferase
VPHGVIIALELAGAVLILAGFTLAQLRLLDQHSLLYLVLNLVGSFVLAVIAWVDDRWGFLLLEGVWSVVSAASLLALLRRGRASGPDLATR